MPVPAAVNKLEADQALTAKPNRSIVVPMVSKELLEWRGSANKKSTLEPSSNGDLHTRFGSNGHLSKKFNKKITHSALPLAAGLKLLYYNTL